jgi:hypothetical protein
MKTLRKTAPVSLALLLVAAALAWWQCDAIAPGRDG